MTQTEAIKLAIEWIEKQPEETPHSKYDVDTRYVVLRELEAALTQPDYKQAYLVWQEKTEWVQETAKTHELGMHRADVLKQRIDSVAQPEDKKCENCGEFGECCQDAQPEQEPVAWYDIEHGEAETVWNKQRPPWEGRWKPLYTTPPQRKPLTDEQINEVLDSMKLLVPSRIARAIEAAHGIKE